ncbi:chemotaxis protein CheA [Paenibacillus albiflavus]|uniref:Chemotaxis protein CheA n=1 Tax=Paenibacillus albiflavus TaxID=2545760 RepID=A0A4R4EN87_9BACL|nr:chemotaxis protein CheA [Paenibacillus albiflavus]TCZ79981.1 chemotaxis protein CheA [Paenibacillus albiflavus]
MELNQYLSIFIDESREHLQALNDNMLTLENNPEDISIVQDIFRSAHTLKGMSATMGFEDLASLTHEMENVLDMVRNHKLQMDSFIFDCIFKSLDSLETMVDDIIQGGTGKADVSQIVKDLKSIVSGEYLAKQEVAAAQTSNNNVSSILDDVNTDQILDEYQYSIILQSIESKFHVFFVEVTLSSQCVLKAARAYMVFNVLENRGEVVKSNPSVQDLEQEKFDLSFSLFYISQIDRESLEKELINISEVESVNILPLDRTTLDEMLYQEALELAATNRAAEETAAATATVTPVAKKSEEKVQNVKPKAASAPHAAVATRTIRVDIDRLDKLINLFSELLIDRVRLEQLASEIRKNELTETVEHMARVSTDLQNMVLKLRMVPIDSVFNRFPRMVRDLAKTLNKKIDFVITGAETELDRTVIEEIGDPLVHLLRNSLDHGVETVEERIQAGKIETGTVHLSAFHSGNHVFIEIVDDGKGISREKVLKSAIKKGSITEEQGAKMTDQEVYQLLFASGFSTAEKISDVSGRGVGLDVVKTKIQSLGGSVQVESTLGVGTKFSVQLPLTLSIISAMLIRLGDEKYAFPLSSIVETAAIEISKIRYVHGNAMLEYRDTVIPILTLGTMLQVPGYSLQDKTESDLVIIRKGDKLAAVLVDELVGQQEIVLKPLGKYLTNLFAVSGATILGDGHVALIIDTNALLK